MNKKTHRLVGTLHSKEQSMRNLISDLENAKNVLSSQSTSDITLSQPPVHLTSQTKRPLTEVNKASINQASQVKRIMNIQE